MGSGRAVKIHMDCLVLIEDVSMGSGNNNYWDLAVCRRHGQFAPITEHRTELSVLKPKPFGHPTPSAVSGGEAKIHMD